MKGYTSIQQYADDFALLEQVRKIHRVSYSDYSIKSVMKKRMNQMLKNASPAFKEMIKRNNYAEFDLRLISLNNREHRFYDIDCFLHRLDRTLSTKTLRNVLRSSAFRNGKLENIYRILPQRIDTRDDLIFFIKVNQGLSVEQLTTICNSIAVAGWKEWLTEAIINKEVRNNGGRFR